MRSCYVAAVEAASIKVHLTWAPWRPTKAPEIQVARCICNLAGRGHTPYGTIYACHVLELASLIACIFTYTAPSLF